jgi:hypothetical protein
MEAEITCLKIDKVLAEELVRESKPLYQLAEIGYRPEAECL